MYECSICQTLNHAFRTHCHVCGTIPSQYSLSGKPADFNTGRNISPAINCQREPSSRFQRLGTSTVSLDYYAESEK